MIRVRNGTKAGYIEVKIGGVLNIAFPGSKTRRARVIDHGETTPTLDTGCTLGVVQVGQIYGTDKEPNPQAGRVYSEEGISPCLDTCSGGNRMPKIEEIDADNIRIRRLTPKECFRLQGWTDDFFDKAQFVNSDSQLYKQAGNGVTVSVIEAMARKMEVEDEQI